MAINKRNTNNIKDTGQLENLTYNEYSGSKKVSEVGRKLSPMDDGTGAGYTTDASTARVLPGMGKNLAVYNNASSVAAISLGDDNTIAALTPGQCDSNGNVGIPCAPNAWTYVACGSKTWVRSSVATLLVFLIDDDTQIRQEASR